MISIIAAITADRAAIGRRGDLLFHISADLRHFKQLTSGHTVVMGRKTFESLPKGALPDRRNIVVTRNAAWSAPGVETATSIEEAMDLASQTDSASEPEIFIIGGGQLYAAALPLAGRMDLTIVDEPTPSDADTFSRKSTLTNGRFPSSANLRPTSVRAYVSALSPSPGNKSLPKIFGQSLKMASGVGRCCKNR